MLPNLHILGIQGSGKGTQSALLVKKYQLTYISSGNLFRERAQQTDELGQIVAEELQKGRLLPDLLLFRVLEHYLASHTIQQGLLGDGVIRTMDQYNGLVDVWSKYGLEEPFLIHLELSDELAMERIKHREEEARDVAKTDFHHVYSGKLLKRSDANPKAIHERLALYHEMTQPVIAEFEKNNRCLHINGDQAIEAIHQQICEGLEARYPHFSNHVLN